jgi:hypothetical protein
MKSRKTRIAQNGSRKTDRLKCDLAKRMNAVALALEVLTSAEILAKKRL